MTHSKEVSMRYHLVQNYVALKCLSFFTIKGTLRTESPSIFLFPDLARKDRSDSASRVYQKITFTVNLMNTKGILDLYTRYFLCNPGAHNFYNI